MKLGEKSDDEEGEIWGGAIMEGEFDQNTLNVYIKFSNNKKKSTLSK